LMLHSFSVLSKMSVLRPYCTPVILYVVENYHCLLFAAPRCYSIDVASGVVLADFDS